MAAIGEDLMEKGMEWPYHARRAEPGAVLLGDRFIAASQANVCGVLRELDRVNPGSLWGRPTREGSASIPWSNCFRLRISGLIAPRKKGM